MSTSDYAARFLNPEDMATKELPAYLLSDFRRLFIRDCAHKYGDRFDVGDFIDYVKTHTYHGEDYSAYLQGFVNKKVAEEQAIYQEEKHREAEEAAKKRAEEKRAEATEREAEAKEQARREYPFSDAAFESDWPRIRAELAVKKVAERRNRTASPRDYAHGVPGGFTTALEPTESH